MVIFFEKNGIINYLFPIKNINFANNILNIIEV